MRHRLRTEVGVRLDVAHEHIQQRLVGGQVRRTDFDDE